MNYLLWIHCFLFNGIIYIHRCSINNKAHKCLLLIVDDVVQMILDTQLKKLKLLKLKHMSRRKHNISCGATQLSTSCDRD
jgi:hypothetical protein